MLGATADFSQLSIKGEYDCNICYEKPGFPTPCNTGNPGEHRFCLDCVVQTYETNHAAAYEIGHSSEFVCGLCKLPFNFQDFLVGRELSLIHSRSEQSILEYATLMRNNLLSVSPVKEFLLLDEEDQKKMISQIYWGNDCLFNEIDDKDIAKNKSVKDTKNQRIKDNLLEMLGNLWSSELDTEEKDQQLSKMFTNGWLVKPCQNETEETLLHRSNLFLRAVLPLNWSINQYFSQRIERVIKFFPEYSILNSSYKKISNLPVVKRAATGPLEAEEYNHQFSTSSFFTVDWSLLRRKQTLRNGGLGYALEKEVCDICHINQGFSPLCHGDYMGEHQFCLDCVIDIYQSTLLCPTCKSPFNFQDFLVVRELSLLHSHSSQSILRYFDEMRLGNLLYRNRNGWNMDDFYLFDEENQREMISKMYWGNDRLFDGVYDLLFGEGDDYSTNNAKNKRIKENLLEILGDPWSPKLDAEEKKQQLFQIFTNGQTVKPCQNETKETFLHRCHIFLRGVLSLSPSFDTELSAQNQTRMVKELFPEYSKLEYIKHRYVPIVKLEYIKHMYVPIVGRPATGPCEEQFRGRVTQVTDWPFWTFC